MGIDVSKMQQKLTALETKKPLQSDKKLYWSPKEGVKYQVRVLPSADGDPFKEFWFHYNIGKESFLCPKKNYGEQCPCCDFANKLYREKTEESAKMGKNFLAKQRFYSNILVRGEEAEGVRAWGYGKNAYGDMIRLVVDPDYGDITDPETGRDLSVLAVKADKQQYAVPKLTARPVTSKLCQGSAEECKTLLDSAPDLTKIHKRKTTQEVAAILDAHLSGSTEGDAEDEDVDTKPEIEKFATPVGKKSKAKSDIDAAFEDLMDS